MSTLLNSLEVAARVASAMRLGLALRHWFRATRRTVSSEGIISKSKTGAKRRAATALRSNGPEGWLRRGESAGAELVVGAADQPTGRLRGALGEPVPAGLHRFQQYLRVDRFQYLRVVGGILERAQVTAPIAPIEKRMLQLRVVLHRRILSTSRTSRKQITDSQPQRRTQT